MPIQLKKEKMKLNNVYFRFSAVLAMAMALIFAVVFGLNVKAMGEGVKKSVILTSVFFVLYFASIVFMVVRGILTYVREDNGAVLFQSIVGIFPIISCFMNLRTVIIMLLIEFNKDDAVMSLIGDKGYYHYISTQYSSWVCLLAGIVVTSVIGILAIVVLLKNKK